MANNDVKTVAHTLLRFLAFALLIILVLSESLPANGAKFGGDKAFKHYTRNRIYDVQHLKLELSFDQPQRRLFGTATLTISPINNGLEQVILDAVELDIKSILLNGNSATGFSAENGKLRIKLDRPYAEDEQFTLAIQYETTPRMGLYFVQPDENYPDKPWQIWSQGEMEESRYWFPGYDFPNDRMTSEMIVTVPEDQMAISNGELLEVTRNETAHTRTFHWRENVPHVTYLVSLVVGEFTEVRNEWEGTPVTYYVEARDRDKVERSFSKTPDMIDFFSEKIGVRYPYEKYAQVTIREFMWGGMENISATTLTRGTLHDARAHLDVSSDGLVAHELAHQWWGDLLTCKNWNHIWLNESFATYFDALYVEHDKGEEEFLLEMRGNRKAYMKEDSSDYRRAIVTNFYEDPSQMFDSHTYPKGAWVLHMIRYILGDELWWKAIHYYAETYREQVVETSDFRKAIEQSTGIALQWFFDQWLFHGGYPEYEVSWNWSQENQTVLLHVQQTQTVDDLTPIFRMPVEIAFAGDFGVKLDTIVVDKADQVFKFALSSKPVRVEFDPHEWILKELRFEKSKEELLNQLTQSGNPAARLRAAQWLARYGNDDDVVKALAMSLQKDHFRGVREQAAESLGKISGNKARNALIDALKDKKSSVRQAAVKALGNFGGEEKVAGALEKTFRNDESYNTEAEAVKSLAKIRADNAYDICLNALQMDSDDEVIRRAGLSGIVELEDPRGIEVAREWSEPGRPVKARSAALKALAKLAKSSEGQKEEVRQYLAKQLDDPDFRIRNAALEGFGELGDRQAIPVLENFIANEVQFKWIENARKAIRKIEDKNEDKTGEIHGSGNGDGE